LAHSVRGSLKPFRAFRRLLGGESFDETIREWRETISCSDVTVERRRVVLRQHKHADDIRVDAIRDRHVYETILSPERHRRLRPLRRKWKQPLAGAPTEDYCQ